MLAVPVIRPEILPSDKLGVRLGISVLTNRDPLLYVFQLDLLHPLMLRIAHGSGQPVSARAWRVHAKVVGRLILSVVRPAVPVGVWTHRHGHKMDTEPLGERST